MFVTFKFYDLCDDSHVNSMFKFPPIKPMCVTKNNNYFTFLFDGNSTQSNEQTFYNMFSKIDDMVIKLAHDNSRDIFG
jgi:hypothetical protein